MYEVIIIGAGPAGLMAARTLKECGIEDFILIDSKKKIGMPLRCGEGIGTHEFHELFSKREYEFIANKVIKHDIIYEDLTRTFSSDFYQLNRPEFEKWLAKDIENKIMLNTKMLNLNVHKGYAEVTTEKKILKTKIVLLCNGCNFKVQQKLGMLKKEPVVVPCYGGLYKKHNLDENKFFFIFDKYPGAMWVFPKSKNIANIGIGIFKHDVNIKKFLSELNIKYKINAEQISEFSGTFPAFGPIDKTYHDRLLVCGNAAGFVFAGTGEGIYFALKSGKIAANVCVKSLKKNVFDKSELKNYEKLWKKAFGKQLKAGVIFLDLLEIGYKFNKMRSMFSSPSEEELRGMVLIGNIPKRAMILWRLSKLFNLKNKKKIPKLFKIMYNIFRKERKKRNKI